MWQAQTVNGTRPRQKKKKKKEKKKGVYVWVWLWAGAEEFSKFDLVVHRNMAKERKISLVLLIPPQSNVTERHRWMRHNQM